MIKLPANSFLVRSYSLAWRWPSSFYGLYFVLSKKLSTFFLDCFYFACFGCSGNIKVEVKMKGFWNKGKKLVIEQSRSLDKDVMYAAFLLLFSGVFLTLAASPAVAERNHFLWTHFIIKHLVFVPIAVGVLLGTALLPIRWTRRLCYLVLMGGIFGMLLVFVGPEVKS